MAIPLLGDPAMVAWPASSPAPLNLSLNTTPEIGCQSLEVSVTTTGSSPVSNARVLLLQGEGVRVWALTDSLGVARFANVCLVDSQDLQVFSSSPGFKPTKITTTPTASGALVYSRHTIDDSAEGDGDGVLEAGERAVIATTFKNPGTATVSSPTLQIVPAPTVTLDLSINGENRLSSVYMGAKVGTPLSIEESFTVPATWNGVRVEGEPVTLSNQERYRLWRKHDTSEYRLWAHSPSASPDSVFTGTIHAADGLTLLTSSIEASDSVSSDGHTIEFSFSGDATPDNISFDVAAKDWLTVTSPSSAPVWFVAAGDSITIQDTLAVAVDAPRGQIGFTASASGGSKWWHTDFAVEIGGPEMELLALEPIWGDFSAAHDTSLAFLVSVRNIGTDQSDSAEVTIEATSDGAVVIQSHDRARFGPIEGSAAALSPDTIIVGSDDLEDLESLTFDLSLTVLHLDRPLPLDWNGNEGGGINPVPPVEAVEVHAVGSGLEVYWDPVSWEGSSGTIHPAYYLVYLVDPQGSLRRPAVARTDADVAATRCWFDKDEDGMPLDGSERISVVAVAHGGMQGPAHVVDGGESPSIATVAGWPKTIPGGATVPPQIYLMDGREMVLTAGRAIYGWWVDDGTPVIAGNEDGLIFDPPGESHADQFFTEALAFTQYIDPEQHRMLYGNCRNRGFYALEFVPDDDEYTIEEAWYSDIHAENCAPMVFKTAWDYDQPQVAITGRCAPGASDVDTLYVWMADGEPFRPNISGVRPGAFAALPAGSRDAWRSMAFYRNEGLPGESSYVVQTTRQGKLICWTITLRTSTALAQPRWVKTLRTTGADYLLSPPVVGDVINDYGSPACEKEIVVTNSTHEGEADSATVWVYDIDGNELVRQTFPEFTFYNGTDAEPPPRPILMCQSTNHLAAVVVGGGGSDAFHTRAYILQAGTLNPEFVYNAALVDSCPRPFRGQEGIGEVWTEPVVADLGGSEGIEIAASTRTRRVFAWNTESEAPEVGWPMVLDDFPSTPAITSGKMFVVDGQTIWCFQATGDDLFWPQYGGPLSDYVDPRANTAVGLWCGSCADREEPQTDTWFGIRQHGDAGLEVRYRTETGGSATKFELFDVQGRRIAHRTEYARADGELQFAWNLKLASGIYFARMSQNGRAVASTRVVVVR